MAVELTKQLIGSKIKLENPLQKTYKEMTDVAHKGLGWRNWQTHWL